MVTSDDHASSSDHVTHRKDDHEQAQPNAPSGFSAPAAGSDDEEEEMPDYSTLEALLDARAKAGGAEAGTVVKDEAAFLPKRGEKDFEPTGFVGQAKALAKARAALYRAISGQRVASAKTLAHAVLDPDTRMATVTVTRRKIFDTTGITVRAWPPHMRPPPGHPAADQEEDQKAKEPTLSALFPEETLYLIERGSLISYLPVPVPSGGNAVVASSGEAYTQLVPLTIEHASTLLLTPSSTRTNTVNLSCTREQYQVYAFLKRLGYIVQRADIVDELRACAAQARQKRLAIAKAASTPVSWTQAVQRTINFLTSPLHLGLRGCKWTLRVIRTTLLQGLYYPSLSLARTLARRTLTLIRPAPRSCGLLGLGLRGNSPSSYNEAFASLQFIPVYTPPPSLPTPPQDLSPFFYAWRPATAYKRTDPPPPEFKIVIVNGSERDLLSLPEFTQLFDLASSEPLEEEDALRAQQSAEQNRLAYGKMAAWQSAKAKALAAGQPEPSPPFIPRPTTSNTGKDTRSWYIRYLPSVVARWLNLPPPPSAPKPRPANPFPALKHGKRNVIVAVVQEGTTSIFRFGESDFLAWKLAGESCGSSNA